MSTPKPGSMNQRTLRRVGALALFTAPALGISLVPVFAGAQDPTRCGNAAVTSREVVSLKFDGNTVYNDAFLANSIITEPSSWWRRYLKFFGRRRCFDQKSFQDDALRLRKLYTTSGYSRVRVDTSVRAVGRNKVAVSFSLREGDPIIVDTLRFLGLDSLPERDAILKHLPILEHNPPRFDMYALQKSIDTITRRLRDAGFPSADVFQETHSDTATQRARIELDVQHGTRAKLRDIDIRITPISGDKPKISEGTVRGLLGIKPNDEYRESRLQRAKRNLYVTEAYRAVSVDVDSVDVIPPGDSLVTVHVSLAEGLMHSGRTSGGYGTIDCFRTEGEYRDNNFLHTAKRFELRARLTKIGIGSPLSGAESLCRWLRDDPYSTKLNYYFGTTFTNPSSVILGFQPSVTLYVERRSEYKAFLRSTLPGALLSGTRQTTRTKQTVGYQFEYRRTEAQPAIFCALQNLCLPEDREPLLAYHRLATVSWVGEQAWANDPQYPSQGGALRLELRHASTVTGSDHSLQFSKATADFSTFFSLGHGIVLAPRIRVGAVVGPAFTGTSKFIPSEERLFAGGPNTLRGFKQNDLGPKVYIARDFDTVRVDGAPVTAGSVTPADTVFFRTKTNVSPDRSVPTGGSALVVGNLEGRIPSPIFSEYLQLAAFVDAGELWSPGAKQREDRYTSIKVTPGVGVRYLSPIGAIRVDIAYNPYAPRAGAAFFDTPVSEGGQLFCVSPGNTLAVTNLGATDGSRPVQATGSCITDFRPPARTSFISRLRLSIGIGQAY